MTEDNVQPLFSREQPKDPGQSGMKMLAMVIEIASARSLLLIAVVGGVAIWAYGMIDPTQPRLLVGAGYSVGVLWPLVMLYFRKG